MWNQIGHVYPEELQSHSKNSGDRKKHNNYTSTLKELAQMLPIPLRTNCKRLTKKEILLGVLSYIEHLQASINTARSLLWVRCREQKEGSEQAVTSALKRGQREATPRAKKSKPMGICRKPRKKRRARKADWNFSSDQGGSKNKSVFSACVAQVAYDKLWQYTEEPGHSLIKQELVHYYSSCEDGEEEGTGTSPWLSTQSSVGISPGNMQLCSPGIGAEVNTYSDLGLSPSLFSSPARLLPSHILQSSQEELSPVLFEDMYLSPQSSNFSQTLSGTLLRKSAFTLDHCYLSYSETGKSDSSPLSRVNAITSSWNKQFLKEATTTRAECPVSSSDENSDSTWTPCKRVKLSQVACQKKKKVGRRPKHKRRPVVCEKHSISSPLQLKKKCVNGFIMFCRLNRKHYIRACPGMASTAATRELAQLWRMMTKQERKPYCMKARRFSRLNNRIVRDDFSSGEEDPEPPKPFHLLLAEKSLPGSQNFNDLSLLIP
ncbi:meiosis initiator protein [Tiliqua scincoides]|uniref:meiosis initiator protein n=1 Tax=Tiliqua scincoides TaxID=71010 RepID=UPI0034626CFF